jgi:hypothetical protein
MREPFPCGMRVIRRGKGCGGYVLPGGQVDRAVSHASDPAIGWTPASCGTGGKARTECPF